MSGGQVSVAVVGAGDIGRGWAALCVAAGWPVAVYDHDSNVLEEGMEAVKQRATALLSLSGADAGLVDQGVASLRTGRSLFHACGDAEWVIEAIPEDLIHKQKLFKALEPAAPKARIITSSSSTLEPSDIAAQCRNQHRILIAHPLNPPELIPLVELLPSGHTDRALIEVLKGWLRALNRIPVTLNKPVRGHIANRISAAVWRESIALFLDGAIGIDDLDRAVSLGPGLAWAGAGPHLTYHLAAGNRGVSGFLQHLLQSFEGIWEDLADWNKLEPEQEHKLVVAIERAYEGQIDQIRTARDRRLASILQALDTSKRG
ncbi:MAG TPA: 3-hydroxyacyl-CoA dehydrogenase NAD-binding domain-containing protein [Gemmatimonadales bacterium]